MLPEFRQTHRLSLQKGTRRTVGLIRESQKGGTTFKRLGVTSHSMTLRRDITSFNRNSKAAGRRLRRSNQRELPSRIAMPIFQSDDACEQPTSILRLTTTDKAPWVCPSRSRVSQGQGSSGLRPLNGTSNHLGDFLRVDLRKIAHCKMFRCKHLAQSRDNHRDSRRSFHHSTCSRCHRETS